jgi:predicted GNAT family acetyltransferase
VQQIAKRSDVPFLHAFASNTVAIKLYESIRFVMRTAMTGVVLRRVPVV